MEEIRLGSSRRAEDGPIIEEIRKIERKIDAYGNWKDLASAQMIRLEGYIKSEQSAAVRIENGISNSLDSLEKQIDKKMEAQDVTIAKLTGTVYGNGRKGLVEDAGVQAKTIEGLKEDIHEIKENTKVSKQTSATTNRTVILLAVTILANIVITLITVYAK